MARNRMLIAASQETGENREQAEAASAQLSRQSRDFRELRKITCATNAAMPGTESSAARRQRLHELLLALIAREDDLELMDAEGHRFDRCSLQRRPR